MTSYEMLVYIDRAKLARLVPVIVAPVGLLVNYRLLKKLGATAMNAYRMRLLIPYYRFILFLNFRHEKY